MQWNVIPFDPLRAEPLAKTLNLPPLMAQILLNRGLYLANQARDFFSRTYYSCLLLN